MSLKLNFKGAMKVMAMACAFASQSLLAEGMDDQKSISGIQCKVEHLGRKATREFQKRSVEDSLVTVAAVKNAHDFPFQTLAKSASYNPATPFFRTGLNMNVASASNLLNALLTPPDANGAIGPEQYIIALNNAFISFNRRTGLPDEVLNIEGAGFFGVNSIADPRILYDHFAKVWYISTMSREPVQGIDILFAVCRDCVITDCSEWDIYRVPGTFLAPGEVFPAIDFPVIAYDSHAVYIEIDVLTTGFDDILGPSLCVFQKSSLLAGNPLLTIFPLFYVPADSNNYSGDFPPINNFDADSEYGYLLHAPIWWDFPQIFDYITMIRVINPGSASPTLSAPIDIQVPPFVSDVLSYPHQGNLFPTSNDLSVDASYVSYGVVRNGQLYTAFGNDVDAFGPSLDPDRGIITWAQLDLSGDSTGCSKKVESPTTVPAIVQLGTIEDTSSVNPRTYWMSSISVNKLGDVVIGGSVTAADEFINVFYSARKRNDPPNTLRNPILVTNNTFPFNFGNPSPDQRWGDYSSIFVDPCNDVNFWLTNESVGIENGFGIHVTELIRLK